jgi:hypothetical protein
MYAEHACHSGPGIKKAACPAAFFRFNGPRHSGDLILFGGERRPGTCLLGSGSPLPKAGASISGSQLLSHKLAAGKIRVHNF